MDEQIPDQSFIDATDRHLLDSHCVILCAGGPYFPGAFVVASSLRELGCELPIELWHLDGEMEDRASRDAIHSIGNVDIVNSGLQGGPKHHGGWRLKIFSVIESRYRHVLYLDSDQLLQCNPSKLFTSSTYLRSGGIFWPDLDNLKAWQWECLGVEPFREERSWESGQFLVDSKRYEKELRLADYWMKPEQLDHVGRYVYGDKDCLHLAFRKYDSNVHVVDYQPRYVNGVVQHGLDGNVMTIHRCHSKWQLEMEANEVHGSPREEKCFGYLEDLKAMIEQTESNE